MATRTGGRIRTGVKFGVWLYVEIALWTVVLSVIGSWASRSVGF